MKYVKSRIEYVSQLNEALLPSQFRKYVNAFDKERYYDIFKEIGDDFDHDKNYYRVYIPLDKKESIGYISDTNKEIDEFLKLNGAEIIDYIKGSAKFNDSKNETSIGKILNRLKNEELSKKFISDEKRKAVASSNTDDLLIVISRHPYDIAGSDTDRDWTNCMTIGTDKSNRLTKMLDELSKLEENSVDSKKIKELKEKINDYKEDGENIKYLIQEVKQGSIVSYLIKKSDKNINRPLAILNIKPYHSKNEETLLLSSKSMYGIKRPEFKSTVDSILEKYFNRDKSSTVFTLNDKVYNDQEIEAIINFNMAKTDPVTFFNELEKAGRIYWKYEPHKKIQWSESNGVFDIVGSINLSGLELTRIPIAFGRIEEDFLCKNNNLTSLINSPKIVNGEFNCFNNELTSLVGSPKIVNGDFVCTKNNLVSLNGAPEKVGGDFICLQNPLESIENGPVTLIGNLYSPFASDI